LLNKDDLGVWTAPLDNHRLAEMEFYLVDELECDLTVFHPYRSLVTLVGKETEEVTARDTMAEGTAMPTALHGGGQDMEIDGIKGESGERYWGTGMGKLLLDDKTLQLAWWDLIQSFITYISLKESSFAGSS
jgi:cyclin C